MPNGMWKHTLLMLHKTINAANIGVHGNLECSFNHSSFRAQLDIEERAQRNKNQKDK